MKETVVAAGVSFVGISVLVFCLVNGAAIISEIQSIGNDFDQEMTDFKILSNEIVSELTEIAKPLQDKLLMARGKRQGYYQQFTTSYYPPAFPSFAIEEPQPPAIMPPQDSICHCSLPSENNCPRGQPGPKGPTGERGLPGLDGPSGLPGNAAQDVETILQDYGTCLTCPAGEPGPIGGRGRTGVRGVRGQRGLYGMPGRDGSPGSNGEHGPPGPPGSPGPQGQKGRTGRSATAIRGVQGSKGLPGSVGIPGISGEKGNDGKSGESGPTGNQGSAGLPGLPGIDGITGVVGDVGKVGDDAMYCPCPLRSRDRAVHNNHEAIYSG